MQANNPLYGLTLEFVLMQLEAHYGFYKLGQKIPIRCFNWEPSVKSSLVFLRRNDWARAKVEELYLRTKFNADTYAQVAAIYAEKKKK